MLYFGSFNPIHRGHIALAEYALREDLCDEVVLIVSPRNPLKESAELAPEVARYEMVEIACAQSPYRDKIKPSIIEFLLERPSYTINTLRHLSENYADNTKFSILMGGDIIAQLHLWREWEEILHNYDIYVYPRRGEVIERHLDKITVAKDAPYFDYSSSEIRDRLYAAKSVEDMLCSKVLEYIHTKKLWQPTVEEYIKRGREHLHNSEWGESLNKLNCALKIEPQNTEAIELKRMIENILKFRHTDIYNP